MDEKTVDFSKTVYELCTECPEAAEILAQLGFTDITKPGMLSTAGRFMTIPKGAAMKKIEMKTMERVFLEHGFKLAGRNRVE